MIDTIYHWNIGGCITFFAFWIWKILILFCYFIFYFLLETKTFSLTDKQEKDEKSFPKYKTWSEQRKRKINQKTSKCLNLTILTLLIYILKSNKVDKNALESCSSKCQKDE